ncbi:MAG: ABC transporter substrate-binding protein [Bernardetiaceae bacterium]
MKHVLIAAKMLFLMLLPHLLLAQSPKEWTDRYQTAKQLLDQGDFVQATTFLRPLTESEGKHPYGTYAGYFYAYAKYQIKDYPSARDMLLQLLQRHPSWDNIDEARYLMGLTQLKLDRPTIALRYFGQIQRTPALLPLIGRAKEAYFSGIELEAAKSLWKEFPKEQSLAQRIAHQMAQKTNPTPEEQRLLQETAELLGQTPVSSKRPDQQRIKVEKDTYYIGVFLPLLYKDAELDPARSRYAFAWDIYEGMRLAAQQLKSEGVPVELLCFDTERKAERVEELLRKKDMQNLDLVVGPLFSEAFDPIRAFAQTNQIAIVNPISTNQELLDSYPQYYLNTPSYATQAKKLADFAMDSLKRTRFYILYGGSSLDSLRAVYFRAAVEQRGGTVRKFERIVPDKDTYLNVHSAIKDIAPEALDPLQAIQDGDPDVLIFASTTHQTLASTINSRLLISRLLIPLLAPFEWLEMPQLKLDQFSDRQMYFFAPDYWDSSQPVYQDFLEQHYQDLRIAPTVYTVKGYETMYFWGKIIAQQGKHFWHELPKLPRRAGYFMPSIYYGNQRDNTQLPILYMKEQKLTLLLR